MVAPGSLELEDSERAARGLLETLRVFETVMMKVSLPSAWAEA